MKQSGCTILARRMFDGAKTIMPHHRAAWIQAMAAECDSIRGERERLFFALGCFAASLHERSKTRHTLAWIGRSLVALSLAAISLGGVALTTQRVDHPVADLLIGLCAVYGLAAPLTLISLRALRVFAAIGFVAASASAIWFHAARDSSLSVSTGYFQALSFEAGLFTAVLFVVATFLSLLSSVDPEAEHHV